MPKMKNNKISNLSKRLSPRAPGRRPEGSLRRSPTKMGSRGAPGPRRSSAGQLGFGIYPILEVLWNPWISSAMALAMSIYRTFTKGNFSTSVYAFLFFLNISLLEMLISFQT